MVASCGAAIDERSGGDHVRGKATEINIGPTTYDDSVSSEEGDHTDWKRFAVTSDQKVTLNLYWDNPSIKSVVFIKDQFGGTKFELKHRTGERQDHWPGIKLREGDYYLQIAASRGSSVYTIELLSEGGMPGSPGGGNLDRPE
jgi:hypothetical protein